MQQKVVKYLKECYQADNRNQTLWNVLSKGSQFLRIATPNEHDISLKYECYPVEDDYGYNLAAAVSTYRREKTPVLCSYFLVGKVNSNAYGKASVRTIFSPLYFTDITYNKNNAGYQIQPVLNSREWNTSLLQFVLGEKDVVDEFKAQVSNVENTLVETLNLLSTTFNFVEQLDIPSSEKELVKLASGCKVGGKLLLVPMSVSVLLDRAVTSRGILDELDLIAKSGVTSAPLKFLDDLTCAPPVKTELPLVNFDNIPGLLSTAQKNIIKTSAIHDLSVLIGPPGTGKTYTIAALALERFMQGESVLIVSRNEHAVDVIRDKLVEHLGISHNAVIRAGTKSYHKSLKKHLDGILKGAYQIDKPSRNSVNPSKLARKVRSYEIKFTRLLNQVERDGRFLYDLESGRKRYSLINRVKLYFGKRRMEKYGLLKVKIKEIQEFNKSRENALSSYIDLNFKQKIAAALKKDSLQLKKFRMAIGSRSSSQQESFFAEVDFKFLLETMPIWLCSLESLHKALPLQNELFDLLIIDEATQCDVASCIPALYRSKRALVVGDPKQLRHVSFLSRDEQNKLLTKCAVDSFEFSYRDHSMIDIAEQCVNTKDAIVMLDEHYRSSPRIIDFSNKRFYQSALRVMTERPNSWLMDSVEIVNVADGVRAKSINEVEAEALVSKLRVVVDEQKIVTDNLKLSIGVVSFFRAQADYIQDLIFDSFSLDEIVAHKIRAGTPYAFQGEERDIILISCCVDSESSAAVYTYMNREDVFNVAITRAREKEIIFLSAPESALPLGSLLRDFIQSINSKAGVYNPDLENRHHVVLEFIQTLADEGIDSLLSYPVAGIEMDVVLTSDNEVLAIDLIGFPGEIGDAFHLDRYKIFERAGLIIIPVSYYAWRLRRQDVVQGIKETFLELREKNKVARLSVADFSNHWTKLLSIDPILADSARRIEADLRTLKSKEGISQIGAIIDQYKKLVWVLGEKLQKSELTYIRYIQSSEQVLLSSLDNLDKIVKISKSLLATQGNSEQRLCIEQLFDQNDRATDSLGKLALKWSKAKTTSGLGSLDMDVAINELEELSNRVENYH